MSLNSSSILNSSSSSAAAFPPPVAFFPFDLGISNSSKSGSQSSSSSGFSQSSGLSSTSSSSSSASLLFFDLLDYVVPAYYVLTTAEASSNLARYDGVRYGHRDPDPELELTDYYMRSRSAGFGREVKRRIMLGSFVLSAGYYDAYFTQAQKVRKRVLDSIQLIFRDYDFIILPNSPVPAFKIGEKIDDPIAMYLADIYTVIANLAGLAAISLPLFQHSNGMPFGLQLISDRLNEVSLLRISNHLLRN